LNKRSCYIRKVTCEAGCIGYALWTLELGNGSRAQQVVLRGEKEPWDPKALDTEAWTQVLKRLRKRAPESVARPTKDIE